MLFIRLLLSAPVDHKLFLNAAVLAISLLPISCNQRNSVPRVSGTIETDEVHVASRYGGRVERIFIREGESLTNGQPIVELDAAELRAQRSQAAAILAELEAGARPEEIAAAKNDWAALVAELEFARTDANRARELYAERTISEVERDRAVSRATALEKSVAAAKSRYDLLLAGTRPERITQAKARLEEIDAQLREMRVVAPTNSILEVLSVKLGDVLAPNQEVATLVLPDQLWIRVYVPQPWLGHLKLDQPVTARVDSFPEKEFDGTVVQINRTAEFTPRNTQTVAERIKQVFGVKVWLGKHRDVLRAGMSADVEFTNVMESVKP
jgi:HlyD family secretion protein